VAFALLLGGVVAPSPARAACGDYIDLGQPMAGHASPDGDAVPDPAHPPRPCTGPSCSQAPVAPIAPVPPPAPVREDRWGFGGDFLAVADSGTSFLFCLDDPARPVRRPTDVYHPPR
jgi:hypothetical protein